MEIFEDLPTQTEIHVDDNESKPLGSEYNGNEMPQLTAEQNDFVFEEDDIYAEDYDDCYDDYEGDWYWKTRNVKNKKTKCRSVLKQEVITDENKAQFQHNDRKSRKQNSKKNEHYTLRRDISKMQKQFEAQKANIEKRLTKQNVKRYKESGCDSLQKYTHASGWGAIDDSVNSQQQFLEELQYRDVTPEDYELLVGLEEANHHPSTTSDEILKDLQVAAGKDFHCFSLCVSHKTADT